MIVVESIPSQLTLTGVMQTADGRIRLTVDGINAAQAPVRLLTMEQSMRGPAGSGSLISTDTNNRIRRGSDNGLFVPDEPYPDPLAHYILTRG